MCVYVYKAWLWPGSGYAFTEIVCYTTVDLAAGPWKITIRRNFQIYEDVYVNLNVVEMKT